MSPLNASQRRAILSSLGYLDQLLTESLRIVREAGGESPFADYIADAVPVQVKVLDDSIRQFRGEVVRVLGDLDIDRPRPRTGALWAARTQLVCAEIALDDLRASRLRGYGSLAQEDAEALDNSVAELRRLLGHMRELLEWNPGGHLDARLQGLEAGSALTDRARRLDEVITSHGLVELRPALAQLVSRLEAPALEIGVFGRVSSGKSSLLNFLLDREALPVGVTPVTAVPVRVVYGETAELTVGFIGGKERHEPPENISVYAAEEENPGNTKGVSRLELALPAARLRRGVTWVDTPGLGSLAVGGAEETRAYLPQCDIGLVLVDAGSTLTPSDLTLLQALLAAGAQTEVLLSKSDVVNRADRDRVVEYTRRRLREELGSDVPVYAVSVLGPESDLTRAWFEERLDGLLERAHDEAMASIAAKAESLSRAVSRRLLERLDPIPDTRVAASRANEDQRFAIQAPMRQLEEARRQLRDGTRQVSAEPQAVLKSAADELARRWRDEDFSPGLARQVVLTHLEWRAREGGQKLLKDLESLRHSLQAFLDKIGGTEPGTDTTALPRPSTIPLFDPESSGIELRLDKPFLLAHSRPLLRRWALGRLTRLVGHEVERALNQYRRRLEEWSDTMVTQLRRGFEAECAARGLLKGMPATKPALDAEDRAAIEEALVALGDPLTI